MNNAHSNPMDPRQRLHMILFFVMLTAAVLGAASFYLFPSVEATPVTKEVKAKMKAKITAKPAELASADNNEEDDEDAADEASDESDESSESQSVLHDEQLPELPEVEPFEMQGIDLEKLVQEEARVQAQTLALKTAKANLKKIKRCLKSTKTKITKNLFRKGKMYGDWTPSRTLMNGKCRTLTYSRDLEADVFTFAAAVSELLEREINSFKLSLTYDDDKGTVTITLLTRAERAKLKWEEEKAIKLAKAKAKQLKLARKLAKVELARRKLAKAQYIPKGSASKLIREGKMLWKDDMKREARRKWRAALKANPTKAQKRKIKVYLSLK